MFFAFLRTYAYHVASGAHVNYSRACVIFYFFFPQTHLLVLDFLPLPIHQQRHVYVSPTSRFDVNEQTTNILRKQTAAPPSPGHLLYDTHDNG